SERVTPADRTRPAARCTHTVSLPSPSWLSPSKAARLGHSSGPVKRGTAASPAWATPYSLLGKVAWCLKRGSSASWWPPEGTGFLLPRLRESLFRQYAVRIPAVLNGAR